MTRSRGGYRGTTDPGSPPATLFRKQIREVGRMTDTPEIDRLRDAAIPVPTVREPMVRLPVAIQAVRDTEDRRTREIVEALRERVLMRAAADFIEKGDTDA